MKWLKKFLNFFKPKSPKKPDSSIPPAVKPVEPAPEIPKEEVEELPVFNPKPNRDNSPVVIVDVYHHDNIVDWEALSAFADGIILKVSEGLNHEDSDWRKWRDEAHRRGMLVGFYHFFRSNKNAKAQADFFAGLVGKMRPGEFCATCDFETEDDASDGFDILEVEEFNKIVEEKLKTIPWIYGGRLLKENVVPARFKRNPLWLSHYTGKPRPVVPAPWERETLWQFTETANVPGIKNPKGTDLNRFSGTYQDLLKMCVQK